MYMYVLGNKSRRAILRHSPPYKIINIFLFTKKIVTVIAYFQKYNFINLQTHTFQNVIFNFLYFFTNKTLEHVFNFSNN